MNKIFNRERDINFTVCLLRNENLCFFVIFEKKRNFYHEKKVDERNSPKVLTCEIGRAKKIAAKHFTKIAESFFAFE